ncbi:MAG: MarC family protein [Gammaproteobacteria bacterium]|nr:MAG: MarC family protein [Gammaproteobacteria bacterium]
MNELLLDSFILLFVVVDPIGLAPLFAALTQDATPLQRRRIAVRGVLIAGGILLVFVILGDALLRALGIGLAAFQIAGGVLLFLLAVDMLFARHSGLRSTTEREQKEAERKKDISVFPLAIPLIAGPGALTTVLLMVGEQGDNSVIVGAALAVVVLVLAVTLVSLLFAARVMRVIGETGANVVSRVFGVVLAALAAQYILDGLRAGLPAF